MIDKTRDAERWDKAMRIALTKEVRAMNRRLYRELLCIYLTQLSLQCRLVFKRAIRKLFLYGKLLKCKSMLLLIESLLLLNKLYDKFSTHSNSPSDDDMKTPNV